MLKDMKWFEKLMDTNRGRFLWVLLMIVVLFIPTPPNGSFMTNIIEAFLAWFAIDYLSNKLKLKHKKTWKVFAVIFAFFTYLIFLFVKRKELRSI